MNELKWETPAPAKAGRLRSPHLAAIAEQMKARPGEWAVVAENASAATTHQWKSGKTRAFPAGEFEFTSRGVSGGRAEKIYGRYVGSEGSAE